MLDTFPGFVRFKAGESVEWKRILVHGREALDTALFDITCQLKLPNGGLAFEFTIAKETSPFRTGCYSIKATGDQTAGLVPQVYDCDVRIKSKTTDTVLTTKTFLVEVEKLVTAPAEAEI